MKFSTVLAVAAMVLAVVASGCRYDDAAGEGVGIETLPGEGDASQIATDGEESVGAETIETEVSKVDSMADDISLDAAGERRFEDYCTRCDDVEFAPVYFTFDSTVIPPDEAAKIDQVAQHLRENADRVVVIEGNCDERGANEYNLALGENRAGIIGGYLTQSGIAASRIQTRSYGEEKPVAVGHDESAWSLNRRGEFAIYRK